MALKSSVLHLLVLLTHRGVLCEAVPLPESHPLAATVAGHGLGHQPPRSCSRLDSKRVSNFSQSINMQTPRHHLSTNNVGDSLY